ncbi:MAG: class I SAM-dependent methyltransferase [Candidatus Dadabacteria bacterium]
MSSLVQFTGSVPANYDAYLGPLFMESFARELVSQLPAKKFSSILEIACGTGRLTNHLLQLLKDDGQLIASDLNEDMIGYAQRKIKDKRVTWQFADATNLPFRDSSFELVACQFGVMFFPDKLKAFREARRVLKPGSVFLFDTWDAYETNPLIVITQDVLKEVFSEDAPDFFVKGPFSFYNKQVIYELLEDAGFKNIQVEIARLNKGYESAESIVKGFVEGSPLVSYLVDKEPSMVESFRKKLVQEIINKFGDSCDDLYHQAILCQGEK